MLNSSTRSLLTFTLQLSTLRFVRAGCCWKLLKGSLSFVKAARNLLSIVTYQFVVSA